MKNLTFYLIVIIIVLAGLGYTYFNLNQKHKAAAQRWEENFKQTTEEVKQINLTVREFKKSLDNKTDSILKIAGVKSKNVTQITNYNTYYTDTNKIVIRPDYDTKTGVYPFTDNTGCFEYIGNIFVDSLARPELNVIERKFFSDFTDIEHIRKDTIHFLGLNLVKWWQKPEISFIIVDNCTGEKRVKKINIK